MKGPCQGGVEISATVIHCTTGCNDILFQDDLLIEEGVWLIVSYKLKAFLFLPLPNPAPRWEGFATN